MAAPATTLQARADERRALAAIIVYAAAQAVLLVALARAADPDAVGRYGLALALITPVVLTTNLQLRNVAATRVDRPIALEPLLRVRLLTVVVDLAVVTLVLAVGGYPDSVWAVCLAVLASKEAESLSDLCSGVYLRHGHMGYMTRSLFTRATLSMVLVPLVVWSTESVALAFVALAVAWAVFAVFVDLRRAGALNRTEAPDASLSLGGLVRAAVPLGLASLFICVASSAPRIVLERNDGFGELGVFTALTAAVTALALGVNSMGQLSVPRLSRAVSTADKAAYDSLRRRLYGSARWSWAAPRSRLRSRWGARCCEPCSATSTRRTSGSSTGRCSRGGSR